MKNRNDLIIQKRAAKRRRAIRISRTMKTCDFAYTLVSLHRYDHMTFFQQNGSMTYISLLKESIQEPVQHVPCSLPPAIFCRCCQPASLSEKDRKRSSQSTCNDYEINLRYFKSLLMLFQVSNTAYIHPWHTWGVKHGQNTK